MVLLFWVCAGMLQRMRIHVTVTLTAEERTQLEQLTRSGSSRARTQTKARILLLTDRSHGERRTDDEIARVLGVSKPTIIRTRRRFALEGLDVALYDRARPGATPKITGEVEAQLTLLACSDAPQGHARWTLQMLADKLVELQLVDSISTVAIHNRLKKRTSPVAREALLHWDAQCEVGSEDGRRAGCVCAPLRSETTGGVCGRSEQRTPYDASRNDRGRTRQTKARRLRVST